MAAGEGNGTFCIRHRASHEVEGLMCKLRTRPRRVSVCHFTLCRARLWRAFMLRFLIAFFALTSCAWAEQLDTKTYCTNGGHLMWQPKGYLVPAPAMVIERELVVGDKILIA